MTRAWADETEEETRESWRLTCECYGKEPA
jgi:hypothetical protein